MLLMVETQPLFGTTRGDVQVAAHGPEEALGAFELLELGGCEEADADKVGGLLDAVHIFADPVECMEVAQTSLAFLYVGLDDVSTVAHALVAGIAFSQLGRYEFGSRAGD